MSDTAVQQSAASESVAEGSLLDQVMANSRMAPADEGYDVARKGVATFIANLLKSDEKGQPVNKALVDQMVVELDRKISAQMDEILHAPKLQELESSWRGLKLMVDRTDFRENIKVDILHATKTELLEDFEFAPDVTQTGFYKHIYAAEYGQFGGEPVGAIVGNYAFSPSTPDMKLLQYVSSVGAMSHAPFLSSVAPSFFGVDSYQELPARPDEKWGETPCAFVTLKPEAGDVSEEDIINFCREHLARFKVPKTVVFTDLPKTSTGKIQKFVLRDQAKELN